MRPIHTFHVRPSIPERLGALLDLAYNLRWSWDHDTIGLFRRLDRELWEESGHNPVAMLGSIPQERLDEVSHDEAFLAQLDRVAAGLREYVTSSATWHRKTHGPTAGPLVAYFSMEFGVTESIPIYSGGLGILAGDHLKSASELGIPLIGVGLLYQKGYFQQYLTAEGWQQERYPVNDFSVMPVRPVHDQDDQSLRIVLDLAGRPLFVRIWRAEIGRVSLLLLDTNIPENPQDLQDITDQLYGGDNEMRIRQEIVLGIGGVRALKALGLHPRVYHMNEGHCAFLGLERARYLMKEKHLSAREALEVIAASGVFTTHTPVPAGIDQFSPDLMERYFGAARSELGLSREELLDLGRIHQGRTEDPFNMAVLAIRTAGYVNGVSRLHGQVSRAMFRDVWPGVPESELPIGHVTNGVHPQSWISDDMHDLYDRYLGPSWAEEPGDTRVWARAEQIPGEELWRTHERRRERLVAFARRRLARQLRARGAVPSEIAQAEEVLDPEILTIGFARRFATYKRGTLILSDPERLRKILDHPERPVQILFAGKAHPKDEPGKKLIRQIVQLARQPEFRRRIVFLEDYDQVVARYLVEGVDVWLNTPRRPYEASGTSGMKASFNGAINLSVLDGWWDEAYSEKTGWAIGRGEEYQDLESQDRIEAGALYELLESEVVPLFYARGSDRLPRGWIALMKSGMGALCPVFNTNRMVYEYATRAYDSARRRRVRLEEGDYAAARELARWKERVRAAWSRVRIGQVRISLQEGAVVGGAVRVEAHVATGGLRPDELQVQVCVGRLLENREITQPVIAPMTADEMRTELTAVSAGRARVSVDSAAGAHATGGEATTPENPGGRAMHSANAEGHGDGHELVYTTSIPCKTSGSLGLTVRAIPHHPDLGHPHETGLIVWAS